MAKLNQIKLFEEKKVRAIYDDVEEKWYFAVVDVCAVLTDSSNPQIYWRVLKNRLKKEGNETVTKCNALKLQAADGKMRKTDVADTEQLFRLIQSIPSPKAEPFKQWMAQVAAQRLDQMQDPELGIHQALADYKRLGYSDNWINQRLTQHPSPITNIRHRVSACESGLFGAVTDVTDFFMFFLCRRCCQRTRRLTSPTIRRDRPSRHRATSPPDEAISCEQARNSPSRASRGTWGRRRRTSQAATGPTPSGRECATT